MKMLLSPTVWEGLSSSSSSACWFLGGTSGTILIDNASVELKTEQNINSLLLCEHRLARKKPEYQQSSGVVFDQDNLSNSLLVRWVLYHVWLCTVVLHDTHKQAMNSNEVWEYILLQFISTPWYYLLVTICCLIRIQDCPCVPLLLLLFRRVHRDCKATSGWGAHFQVEKVFWVHLIKKVFIKYSILYTYVLNVVDRFVGGYSTVCTM